MSRFKFPRDFRWPWRTKRDIARDVEEEITFHLNARAEELVGNGMDPAAARAQAEREFGDIEAARGALRASDEAAARLRRRLDWLGDLRQDLRLASRTLIRNPGFAGAAVAVLTFGMGLAVAMFAVFNAVLRQPLPVQDQDRVVALWLSAERNPLKLPLTYAPFEDFRENALTLDDLAGTLFDGARPYAAREGERVTSLNVAAVTGNFFLLLGTAPVLGRTLRPEDDIVGAAPVAVISHTLWQRHFGADADVIGRRLTVHERELTYTVVGVAPAGLAYPTGTDLWVPLIPFATPPGADVYSGQVYPLGRLAHGATPTHAAAELLGFVSRDASVWQNHRIDVRASTLSELVTGDVKPALIVLSAAAALLLLIACVNVANLLFVRASGRREEIAVRRALGADRGRIVRQLLTESSLLAVAGGVLAAVLAIGLVQGLLVLAPPELPRLEEIGLSGVPLGLVAAVTLAAVLVFGLVPAIWTSRDVASPLWAGVRSVTGSRTTRRAQYALVVFQVGLAIVVLVAGGLLSRTLLHLERLDIGFDTDQLMIVQLTAPWERFDTPDQVHAFFERLIPRIEALPDVASSTPLHATAFAKGSTMDGLFVAEDGPEADRESGRLLNMQVVGTEFFRTLGVPLLRGRSFTESDREDAPRVAVVDEAVARLFWPGEDPVGKRVGLGQPPDAGEWWTVVGVVSETRYRALREPAPTVYLPDRQFSRGASMVAVRTSGAPTATLPSIRQAVRETDPDVLILEAESMHRLVSTQLAQPRLSAVLLGAFGIGALLLAAIGLYAVLASVVRQRTRELAIRHALGASPSRLRSLVLKQALVMAGIGVLLGLTATLAGGRLLQSLLFGVSPTDPLTLVAVATVVMTVAVAASYIPARRATRADAAAVLREE